MIKKFMLNMSGSLAAAGLVLLLAGCAKPEDNTIFQVCTIDALFSGVYDGQLPCTDTTPFATVCRFVPEQEFPLSSGMKIDSLKALIDRHAPNMNLFCALKVSGTFSSVLTRSVPGQEKPYPLFTTVTARQAEFRRDSVSGTIVGFRVPAYFKGINIPGYHLHFISNEGTFGGHLLDFTIIEGQCSIDVIHRFQLRLPEGDADFAKTDLSHDRSHEYEEAEGN